MKKTKTGKLYPAALAAVRGCTLTEAIKQTGLPDSWLRKFRQGTIKNPSVQRAELIIEKLSEKSISIL